MLRKIALSVLAILSPLMLSVPARAQSALLFGQKHYYSVTFRANQEAIVYARIVLTNNSETPMTTAKFTNGSSKINELVALQMILPRSCDKYSNVYPTMINTPACDKYSDPDYTTTYSYNPDGEQTQYFPLKTDKSDSDFTVNLSKPIEASKSGSIVLAYVSKDYVTSGAYGVKNYDFKTLGAEARQGDTAVANDVDSGLTLKGAIDEKRDGIPPMMGIAELSTKDSAGTVAISNKTLDSTVSGIGSGGKKSETATGVAPGEQFSARGSYAADSWRLYAKVTTIVIIATVGTVLLFVLILIALVRKWLRPHKKQK